MGYKELIEYFENKGISEYAIKEILEWLVKHDKKDKINIISQIDYLYDIFSFVGLNNEQIELFIVKNTSVLKKEKGELNKIAFVLKYTDVIDKIFKLRVNGLANYKRVFVRDYIIKHARKDYYSSAGLGVLTCYETQAYGSVYNLDYFVNCLFQEHSFSDLETESHINKRLTINGKRISVDDYITLHSKLLYARYLRYKTKMANKGTSK